MDVTSLKVREQLSRILASPVFSEAGRVRDLLAFLTDIMLEQQAVKLIQHRIAIDIFKRSADFDPAEDAIVRVEAGRLRRKLYEYYATFGVHDEVVLSLPKGHLQIVVKFRD